MMTLRQLRYFDALARNLHFGRAANAVGVSQPALSVQIRELEQTLGAPLVERSSAGARLTALGVETAERAGRILASLRDLEELGRAHGDLLSGRLRLGIIPSIAPYLLPALLARARDAYPRLQLSVRETVTEVLVAELLSGALDAIVASLPLEDERLEESPAFDDRFLLAAPAGSPHASRSPAIAELINADELLLLEDGHCLRDQALSVCRNIDPRRLRSFGATSLLTVLQLVAAGQGVTLVPQLAVDAGLLGDPRLTLVRFAPPEPSRVVGVAWRRSSPRERDFRALAEMIAEGAPRPVTEATAGSATE